MDQKQLITFKIAAETLNFTKTAQILNYAQSTVTAQIKALETNLDIALFERLGKRIILTEAGIAFKHYADKMIKLSEEAKVVIHQHEEPTSTLTIGAQESQLTYRLPQILKDFTAQYPQVKLIFKPAHADKMAREQLMNGELDIAFIMDVRKPEASLRIEPLIEEKIVLVASPHHSLAKKTSIQLTDIATETLLLTENGCAYRTLLESACDKENVHLFNKFEFSSVEAIKQCVIAGIGLAALPEMIVKQDISQHKIVKLPWDNDLTPFFTHIAWHKDKWMQAVLTDFIDITKKHFQQA